MVRVTCEHEASMNHFSHPHPLQLSNFQAQQNMVNQFTTCSACKLKLCDWVYSCTTCNFFLHAKCTKMPKQITHPYHKEHVLELLSTPPYRCGSFLCDACGDTGDGFVYNCKGCERDLHLLCAVIPISRTHATHPHELELTFDVPFFECDICRGMGKNCWLYMCKGCDFTVHLGCINRSPVNSLSRSTTNVQPYAGMDPGMVNPVWNQGYQPGQFVAANHMNTSYGYPAFNQVPQNGHFMPPGVAPMQDYQRVVLNQAILQMRGAPNTMQNRAAMGILESMINGGGNGIGSTVAQNAFQSFGGGGGGGGGGGLDMLQNLLGGGGVGIPGLDIGGLGDILGGLGGLF